MQQHGHRDIALTEITEETHNRKQKRNPNSRKEFKSHPLCAKVHS